MCVCVYVYLYRLTYILVYKQRIAQRSNASISLTETSPRLP